MSAKATYLFMPQRRYQRAAFRAIWLLNAAAGIALLGAVILMGSRWIEAMRLGIPMPSLLIGVVLLAIVIFFLRNLRLVCAAWVSSADLAVDDRGVRVMLVEGAERLVPWADLDAQQIRLAPYRPLLRLVQPGEVVHTVPAASLGLLYRIAGLAYGAGFRPVFVVTPDHDRHDELLARIRDRQPLV